MPRVSVRFISVCRPLPTLLPDRRQQVDYRALFLVDDASVVLRAGKVSVAVEIGTVK